MNVRISKSITPSHPVLENVPRNTTMELLSAAGDIDFVDVVSKLDAEYKKTRREFHSAVAFLMEEESPGEVAAINPIEYTRNTGAFGILALEFGDKAKAIADRAESKTIDNWITKISERAMVLALLQSLDDDQKHLLSRVVDMTMGKFREMMMGSMAEGGGVGSAVATAMNLMK